MGVVISPESALGVELTKWEQHQTRVVGDNEPGNPYVYRPFPKMLYKAQRHARLGKIMATQSPPNEYEFRDMNEYMQACNAVEAFNRSCQRIVNSEDELRVAKNDGWCEGPDAAIAAAHARDTAVGNETAERHYRDSKMSDKAQAEIAALHASADFGHIPDPVIPKRKRKYTRKNTVGLAKE